MKHLRSILILIVIVYGFSSSAVGISQTETIQSQVAAQIPSKGSAVNVAKLVKENSRKIKPNTPSVLVKSIPILNIKVGEQTFKVKLYDNASVSTLLKELPLTIEMRELNGNEKFYKLSKNIPNNSQRINEIHAGDLMLYGSDNLVLFYEDFSASYSYTPLGLIENPEGLSEALGKNSVTVIFEIKTGY